MARVLTCRWFGSWMPPCTRARFKPASFGVYTRKRRDFSTCNSLGASFDIKDMPLDIEVLRSAATEVKDQFPILQTAKMRDSPRRIDRRTTLG